ncbi:MAG: hypothetical protein KC910_21690 [Candidatus Eremiobacteraeota bacterium]|nr:hypothetical protein [Candidatus Eremiobacteraeota bacterium]
MRARAFTFAEVVVAVGILAIAALALVGVHLYAAKASHENQQQHRASLAAASLLADLEDALSGDPDLVVPGGEVALQGFAGFNPSQPHQFSAFGDFRFELDLPPRDASHPLTRRADLEVRWSDQKGSHRYHVWTAFYVER